jgi:hypothetical protein
LRAERRALPATVTESAEKAKDEAGVWLPALVGEVALPWKAVFAAPVVLPGSWLHLWARSSDAIPTRVVKCVAALPLGCEATRL